MKRGFLVLSALVTLGVLMAAGCTPPGDGANKTNRLDRGDDYYTGPLRVGRPYQTLEQNTFTRVGGDYDPAVSPDGTKLIFSSTYHSRVPEIYMKSVNGATVTRLTSTPDAEIQPCFSPDGKRFAYATNRRGNWDICIEPVAGSRGDQRQQADRDRLRGITWVTHSMGTDEISPSFHPSKDWIAFSSYNLRAGRWEIVVKNYKNGRTRYLGEGLFPKFSPDGKKIAFQRARSREPRWYSVWTVEVDEEFNATKPTEVVSNASWAAINPSWSPKGDYLVFATVHESPIAQDGKRILMGDDIWIVNLQGQDLVKLTTSREPESHPVWTRDKKGRDRIYFCSMVKGPKNIWSLNPLLPWPRGSVKGPLPGPREKNPPPPAPGEKTDPDTPGALHTYMAPPPPAVSAGGSSDN